MEETMLTDLDQLLDRSRALIERTSKEQQEIQEMVQGLRALRLEIQALEL